VPSPLMDRLRNDYAAVASSLPAHIVPAAVRSSALAELAERGLPTTRDENWRYSDLRALDRASFQSLAAPQDTRPALSAALDGYTRFVFIDGHLVPGLSAPLDASLSLRVVRAFAPDARALQTPTPDERFALVSDAFAPDGLHVTATGADAVANLEVLFVSTSDGKTGTSYPRLFVEVARGAKLELVERHLSTGTSAASVNSLVRCRVQPTGTLSHVRWQSLARDATWIDTHSATVDQDAAYHLRYVATGARTSRSTVRIALTGRAAQLELSAAAAGDEQQSIDIYAEVDHAAPGAATREMFRGIAAGRSKVAFNGKMIVRETALGASSDQSLRSLLAGPSAEIAARPQLEIYTDDVRAAHGATAGKLDEQMLFYLLSRGLDRETAQALLKWAFIEDAIAKVAPPSLRREIELHLAGQFKDIAALDGLLGERA
jgi:Fe-S cluster assembly protein SufD